LEINQGYTMKHGQPVIKKEWSIAFETGIENIWVTCRLVSCGHIVFGHAVAGDIS
jgi:hypothetical protein